MTRNLDNGKRPSAGESRHADNLISDLVKCDIREQFESLFGQKYAVFYGEWKEFENAFFNKGR